MRLDHMLKATQNCGIAQLDELMKAFWQQYANGNVTDQDAEILQTAIDHRRTALKNLVYKPKPMPLLSPPPRSPRSKERIHRRRRVAQCGAMPPAIACNFTTGEAAALTIILAEIKRCGCCQMYVGQIANMAGVCARTVQRALRTAEALGLIQVTIRKQRMAPNLPNKITLVCTTLNQWISRSGALKGRVTILADLQLQTRKQSVQTMKTPNDHIVLTTAMLKKASDNCHFLLPVAASGTIL